MRIPSVRNRQAPAACRRRLCTLPGIFLTATAILFVLFFGNIAAGDPPSNRPVVAPSGGVRTIIDLQPFRQTSEIRIKGPAGEEGLATLIQLNPYSNDWSVLRLTWPGAAVEEYHLENNVPRSQRLLLDGRYPSGLIVAEGGKQTLCELWKTGSTESLQAARALPSPYASLCGGKLYLRNPAKGHQTPIEKVTEFLRKEIPAGDKIVNIVRDLFFKDAFREKAETAEEPKQAAGPVQAKTAVRPPGARIDPAKTDRVVVSSHLGIDLQEPTSQGIIPGRWYAAKDNPGVFVSLITPGLIAPDILRSYRGNASALDKVESEALVYLIAFDLDRFDVKFSRGTEHPGVGWSGHVQQKMKDPSLPGPDGIGTIAPLVSTGLVNPKDAGRTVAAFAGGFKRYHGAFKWGPLAQRNHGSHYGFIEGGVVFSRLQPGLATLYVLRDGRVNIKTWLEEDDRLLPGIRYARQNGVPIIAGYDLAARMPVPGPFVSRWGEGNWSGSEDKKLRTMRAGAALQETAGKRYLLYAVFTGATPSAMARVFQAYGCLYAMHLDMNALELTYLAVYKRQGSDLHVQHLIQGMSQSDKSTKGQYIPRFLALPDNRDFFTVLRKEAP